MAPVFYTKAYFSNLAQAHQFVLAGLQNGKEDVGCAQVFAAPLVTHVLARLQFARLRAFPQQVAHGDGKDAEARIPQDGGSPFDVQQVVGEHHFFEGLFEGHEAHGMVSRHFPRRASHGNDRVDVGLGKGAAGMVVDDQMERGLPQKELLKPGTVVHIQPGIGADEDMHAVVVEQAQGADVKVGVEVRAAARLAPFFELVGLRL